MALCAHLRARHLRAALRRRDQPALHPLHPRRRPHRPGAGSRPRTRPQFAFTWNRVAGYATTVNTDNPTQIAPSLTSDETPLYPFVNTGADRRLRRPLRRRRLQQVHDQQRRVDPRAHLCRRQRSRASPSSTISASPRAATASPTSCRRPNGRPTSSPRCRTPTAGSTFWCTQATANTSRTSCPTTATPRSSGRRTPRPPRPPSRPWPVPAPRRSCSSHYPASGRQIPAGGAAGLAVPHERHRQVRPGRLLPEDHLLRRRLDPQRRARLGRLRPCTRRPARPSTRRSSSMVPQSRRPGDLPLGLVAACPSAGATRSAPTPSPPAAGGCRRAPSTQATWPLCEGQIVAAGDAAVTWASAIRLRDAVPARHQGGARRRLVLLARPGLRHGGRLPDRSKARLHRRAWSAAMNYEGGCNPVNVTYLEGLGLSASRDGQPVCAERPPRAPPSGIPIG